jgi:hypothetical protein
MFIPSEHDYIEKLKHLTKCRLEWVESTEWKNRDFEYLSELIFEKTKISISVSTLKRIWKNDESRIPHVSTLNALALFLDYENWNEFKTKLKSEIKPLVSSEEPILQKKKTFYVPAVITISGLIILSILLFSLTSKKDKKTVSPKKIDEKQIVFTSKKTVSSGLPNTVVFNYDISKIDFDSAFIQQDWDNRKRKEILKENQYHTCIYYYPGFYTAKLAINDQVVKEFPLFITTDGWMAVYKKEYYQEIPIYLKNINLVKNKCLHVSVEDLKSNKIENDKDFLIGFYNARDFGQVYCDSFSFETEVKNDPRDGGLTCQYASVNVQGQMGNMTATFCDKGCTSELFLSFGDVYLEGSKNDLSAFGTDLTNWRKIKYQVVNKNVSISIDGKEIYQLKYERDMGKIIGINYHFYGCGSVKSARLYDKSGVLVYEEGF